MINFYTKTDRNWLAVQTLPEPSLPGLRSVGRSFRFPERFGISVSKGSLRGEAPQEIAGGGAGGRAAALHPLDHNHIYIGRFGLYDFYVGSVGIAANPIPKNTLILPKPQPIGMRQPDFWTLRWRDAMAPRRDCDKGPGRSMRRRESPRGYPTIFRAYFNFYFLEIPEHCQNRIFAKYGRWRPKIGGKTLPRVVGSFCPPE